MTFYIFALCIRRQCARARAPNLNRKTDNRHYNCLSFKSSCLSLLFDDAFVLSLTLAHFNISTNTQRLYYTSYKSEEL